MAIKMVTVAIKITGTTTIKAIAYIGMPAEAEEVRRMPSQAESMHAHTLERREGCVNGTIVT